MPDVNRGRSHVVVRTPFRFALPTYLPARGISHAQYRILCYRVTSAQTVSQAYLPYNPVADTVSNQDVESCELTATVAGGLSALPVAVCHARGSLISCSPVLLPPAPRTSPTFPLRPLTCPALEPSWALTTGAISASTSVVESVKQVSNAAPRVPSARNAHQRPTCLSRRSARLFSSRKPDAKVQTAISAVPRTP